MGAFCGCLIIAAVLFLVGLSIEQKLGKIIEAVTMCVHEDLKNSEKQSVPECDVPGCVNSAIGGRIINGKNVDLCGIHSKYI